MLLIWCDYVINATKWIDFKHFESNDQVIKWNQIKLVAKVMTSPFASVSADDVKGFFNKKWVHAQEAVIGGWHLAGKERVSCEPSQNFCVFVFLAIFLFPMWIEFLVPVVQVFAVHPVLWPNWPHASHTLIHDKDKRLLAMMPTMAAILSAVLASRDANHGCYFVSCAWKQRSDPELKEKPTPGLFSHTHTRTKRTRGLKVS